MESFDAIVIGSGISGGWAAKELTEKGLKTLVIERGRSVEHIKDYPTALLEDWDLPFRNKLSLEDKNERPIQSSVCNQANKHFFVKDSEHPYIQENPFNWIRGYQVGGRSLTWGRQCYRFSDIDFDANRRDGVGVDWPIRYADLEKWYDYVEEYVGVSGSSESLKQLPDGPFLPPIEMNCIERYFSDKLKENYNDRKAIVARMANLTAPKKGRGQCLYRDRCDRGCPFGGYFSSNSSTLLDAKKTGNLTLITDEIVKEITFDPTSKKARGVKMINAKTKTEKEISARLIFLNASTIASTSILLNSKCTEHPNGLGNSSDQIGRNLMGHISSYGSHGITRRFLDKNYKGRSPGALYLPRYQNLDSNTEEFLRGFAFQIKGRRQNWRDKNLKGIGASLKEELFTAGFWTLYITGRGEVLPNEENRVQLSSAEKDKWGIPLVSINFSYGDNELKLIEEMKKQEEEMLSMAGFEEIRSYSGTHTPGSAVHEMGTARMGRDPRNSVLNGFNQMHDVPNIFITDGSFMTSSGVQNPSLTYMAATARACEHAVELLKNGIL